MPLRLLSGLVVRGCSRRLLERAPMRVLDEPRVTRRKKISPRRDNQTRSLLTEASLCLWTLSVDTRQFTWQGSCARLFGLADGAELSREYAVWERLIQNEDRPGLAEAVNTAIQNKSALDAEFRVGWTDGSLHWLEMRGQPRLDANGMVTALVGTLMDVSPRKAREEAARVGGSDEAETLAALLTNTDDLIALTDSAGRLLSLNAAGRALIKLPEETVLTALLLRELLAEEAWRVVQENGWPAVRAGQRWMGELAAQTFRENTRIDVSASLFPVRRGPGGEPTRIAVILRDIRECKENQRQVEDQIRLIRDYNAQLEVQREELTRTNYLLRQQASINGPTGLYNREAFGDRLKGEIERSAYAGRPLSLMMLDIDHFKRVNDTRGHKEGNRVLKKVADVLSRSARQQDVVSRYGGEEFAIFLPGAEREDALKVAERMRIAVAAQDWAGYPMTISIGVTTQIPNAMSLETLYDEADEALYAAKDQGRNRVVHFSDLPKTE